MTVVLYVYTHYCFYVLYLYMERWLCKATVSNGNGQVNVHSEGKVMRKMQKRMKCVCSITAIKYDTVNLQRDSPWDLHPIYIYS